MVHVPRYQGAEVRQEYIAMLGLQWKDYQRGRESPLGSDFSPEAAAT
jgi:hypothetical protein